jgi:hypothetical protein
MGKMVNRKRVRILKEADKKAGPIVYWMSRDQRVRDNWALLFAQELALQERVPMAVVFCLAPRFLDVDAMGNPLYSHRDCLSENHPGAKRGQAVGHGQIRILFSNGHQLLQ